MAFREAIPLSEVCFLLFKSGPGPTSLVTRFRGGDEGPGSIWLGAGPLEDSRFWTDRIHLISSCLSASLSTSSPSVQGQGGLRAERSHCLPAGCLVCYPQGGTHPPDPLPILSACTSSLCPHHWVVVLVPDVGVSVWIQAQGLCWVPHQVQFSATGEPPPPGGVLPHHYLSLPVALATRSPLPPQLS